MTNRACQTEASCGSNGEIAETGIHPHSHILQKLEDLVNFEYDTSSKNNC